MIFRRFAGNLRHQDWTAVAVSLAVVVLGVFIGLQVSNWNEDRQTAAKSAAFTQRLRADLRVEAWGYQYLIDYYTDVLANAERSIDGLTCKRPVSDEALLVSAYRASQYSRLHSPPPCAPTRICSPCFACGLPTCRRTFAI